MKLINKIHFGNLQGDLFGGLTAAIVALPMALAFGVASGAGAIAGLYCAVFLGFFGNGGQLDFGLNDFGFWIVLFLKEEAC